MFLILCFQILEAQTKQARQAYQIMNDRQPYTYDKVSSDLGTHKIKWATQYMYTYEMVGTSYDEVSSDLVHIE